MIFRSNKVLVWVLAGCLSSFSACGTTEEGFADPLAREAAKETTALGERLLQEGRVEEALERAEEALDEDPGCLPAVMLAADCLERLERPDEAFALLLKESPSPTWKKACLTQAGKLARRMNQPSLAVAYLNRAVALAPDDAELLAERAEAEAAGGLDLAASKSFRQALELGGDEERIIPGLAKVLFELKEYEEAESLLENRVPRDHLGTGELMLLGVIKCHGKKLEEGLRLFQEVVARGESLPEAHFNQGYALEALGDGKSAEAAYRRALGIDPDYPAAAFNLGCLLFRDGRRGEGLALIDEAIEKELDAAVKRALEETRQGLVGEGDSAKKKEGTGTPLQAP